MVKVTEKRRWWRYLQDTSRKEGEGCGFRFALPRGKNPKIRDSAAKTPMRVDVIQSPDVAGKEEGQAQKVKTWIHSAA